MGSDLYRNEFDDSQAGSHGGGIEVDVLIAELVSRIDRGEAVDLPQVLKENPHAAEEVESFFTFGDDLLGLLKADLDQTIAAESLADPDRTTVSSITAGTVPELDLPRRSADQPPAKIGRYQILGQLGRGTFGNVYVAHDPAINQKVAIKEMRSDTLPSAEARRGFLHEAKAVAQLDHPGIVRVLNVHDEPGQPLAIVLQYIEGKTLKETIQEEKPSRELIVTWIAQIANALHYAHSHHIVHRDLKPDNIVMREQDGVTKPVLLDFGLATIDERSFREGSKQLVGTTRYMSPEQANHSSEWATAQSDIFSLGVMLYQLLTRKLPFKGDSQEEILRQVCEKTPAMPSSIDDTITPELERICLKALEKRPTDRYANAREMARDLFAAIDTQPQPSPQPSTTDASIHTAALVADPVVSRKFPAPVLGAVAVSLMVGVAAALYTSFSGSANASKDAIDSGRAQTAQVDPQTNAENGATNPTTPLTPKATAQPVKLALTFRKQGDKDKTFVVKQAGATKLNERTLVKARDEFQLTADIPQQGHFYAIWFPAESEGVELATNRQGGLRDRLQEPQSAGDAKWLSLGESEELAMGVHMVVAFSTPEPLTETDLQQICQTDWTTPRNSHDKLAFDKVYHPAPSGNAADTHRGGDTTKRAAPKIYGPLGDLTDVLQSQHKANYQAVIFRVYEDR